MNVVFIILTVLIVLAAILLIGVVLLQNSKGDGMASNFVAGNQTFGVRQTADILEKITWGLVVFIFIISIATSFSTNVGSREIDYTEKIETETAAPEFPATIPSAENPAEAPAETPAE